MRAPQPEIKTAVASVFFIGGRNGFIIFYVIMPVHKREKSVSEKDIVQRRGYASLAGSGEHGRYKYSKALQ